LKHFYKFSEIVRSALCSKLYLVIQNVLWLVLLVPFFMSCSSKKALKWHKEKGYRWAEISTGYFSHTGFEQLDLSDTDIEFKNNVSKESIAYSRSYLNGSGVAVGDVDGDGLVDIYLAQIDGPNKLYKNLGNFEFRDITEQAGVAHPDHHSTGVVFADVDGDGDLDLLVSALESKNTLYINDGKGHFTVQKDSGLGDGNGSTTMALADIDHDGDLDLYVAHYKIRSVRDIYTANELSLKKTIKKGADGKYHVLPPFDKYFGIIQTKNRLYRNEYGVKDELFINNGKGKFEKVLDTKNRFLDEKGNPQGLSRDWGLTARFQDINDDGSPDLYVCNDFWTPDRIWINQGDGTFRAIQNKAIRNFSFSSMGVDFGDINRDGSTDFFVTEMLSPDHQTKMRQLTQYLEEINGRPQYNRNSLYLNRGDNTFAEISNYSGMAATGWSWVSSFMDVDLDGYEDIVTTTGNGYDYQDLDTQQKMDALDAQNQSMKSGMLGYPPLKLANKVYRNNKDLTFTDVSKDWGFTEKDISQGMAMADFDNDGDLDLVMNRFNETASIYENTTGAGRVAVQLHGSKPNTRGIGGQITFTGGPVEQQKQIVVGGNYDSGSQPMAVFATGNDKIDGTLTVQWPSGKVSKIEHVQANRIYEVDEKGTSNIDSQQTLSDESTQGQTYFEDISNQLPYQHHEDHYGDYNVQPLLPVKLSRQGPGIAWIDYDQDGDDDLFIASGKGGRMGIFKNDGSGHFTEADLGSMNRIAPGDQTAVVGWPENGTSNIMVGSANFEQGDAGVPSAYRYQINGSGKVMRDSIPGILSTTGPMAAADYDGDGDLDLFVGGRFKPGNYPASANSRLFLNEDGQFVLDKKNTSDFNNAGLVTGAVFTDFDQDGDPDLLISTEWGSLRLFQNNDTYFNEVTNQVGLDKYNGWWNSVTTGDFNNDGLPDIVATNMGQNSSYQLGSGKPLKMYYGDLDSDGRPDILETHYDKKLDGYVPDKRLYQLSSIKSLSRNVSSNRQFASLTIGEIFNRNFSKVPSREINTLKSTLFINRGEQGFQEEPLPDVTQFTAAMDARVADFDNDGNEDLYLSQNYFEFPPVVPRLDAGRGLLLLGDGKAHFSSVSGMKSGIEIYGEQRGAALSDFNSDGKTDLVVAQNNGPVKLYSNNMEKRGIRVSLHGPAQNKEAFGSSIRMVYDNGAKGPRREIQAGSGYWSQNSATQVMGTASNPKQIEVTWFDGKVRTVDFENGKFDYNISYK